MKNDITLTSVGFSLTSSVDRKLKELPSEVEAGDSLGHVLQEIMSISHVVKYSQSSKVTVSSSWSE